MDSDKRFAHIATDPKFRKIPKSTRNVKIDKRFQSMFDDKKFNVKYTVDKRGRPVNHSTTEDLKRYYELNSDNEEESAEGVKEEEVTEQNDLNVKLKTDIKLTKNIKKKLKDLNIDFARGEGRLYSESSSDDEESSDEDEEISELDHMWGELDAEAEKTEEATYRLAACNMDWDRIRAVDLMVLLNSFIPPGGAIKSIAIYTSEFGKERLAEEEIKGPIELTDGNVEEEEETEEGGRFHMEKLRKYQLNRLKYYYAVIICDSANTANKIYTECDGIEYESSATKMDLRFIPDDMEFDEEPKEMCDKMPEANKYQPRSFTTTALQQAKVDLTWDETNPDRIELTNKLASGKLDNIDDTDLQQYLASSSGEEEEDDDDEVGNDSSEASDCESTTNPIDKYKSLLQEIELKEKEKESKDVGLEISWGINLKEKTDELIKKKQKDSENRTPFQQYLDKRKEKRKEKREQRKNKKEAGESGDSDSDDSDIPADIDMNDPYFAEEFDKPEFKKKKSKNNDKKNRNGSDEDENAKAQLELLLNDEDDNKKHFSLKKILDAEANKTSKKKKNKESSKQEVVDDFKVDVTDERFSALYTSHHYNIEPTDPNYKKTKSMELFINEKLKRRTEEENDAIFKKPKVTEKKTKAELSVLVKSIKRNAQSFNKKQKKT